MAERKKLGELLKEAGLIDDFQLQSALSHQRNWGGKLGAILAELDFAREEDIARVISEKMRIPYVNLFEPELPLETRRLLKADAARKYCVMPVRKEGNTLVLAMSDPTDIRTMDEIRFITGHAVKPVLAMESEIRDAIRQYYDGQKIDRGSRISFRETAKKSGQMELVHEMHETVTTDKAAQEQRQQDLQSLRQDVQTQRRAIEALVAVLIEKDLITRDELVKMIEQKKMGL